MATIDIGKIKPVFKGTYDNSTAYVLDDIVYYNGSSYVAKTSTTERDGSFGFRSRYFLGI